MAPVTVVFFADLQCPFTARAYRTLERLREDYGRQKVRVVFKHHPLPFQEEAKPAAVAASVVYWLGGPEAFWPFVFRVLDNQRALEPATFERWAREPGVDVVAFRQAMQDPQRGAKVDADLALVKKLGFRGTPHSIVNGQSIKGAPPIEKFRQAIDDQLVHARVLSDTGVPPDRIYVRAARDSYGVPVPKTEREDSTVRSRGPTARSGRCPSVVRPCVDRAMPS